jgi:hypothetical protein
MIQKMISKEKIINDLALLGRAFGMVSDGSVQQSGPGHEILATALNGAFLNNPWFLPDFTRFAFTAWAQALKEDKIKKWLSAYDCTGKKEMQTVGLIMAGNIPMVGLHDLLCVLTSGNRALIKLSSSDDMLIPAVLKVLCEIDPDYKEKFAYADGPLKGFDAIIATGSNNSSRYFDYYFGKYPHIIRKNRNGTVVLTGEETPGILENLADDIFMYFGLGCRNVSKIYIPEGYDVEQLFPHFSKYSFFADHHKYRNNYDYQKSILLINGIPHHDNGFLLIRQDRSLISPISVIHYESYKSIGEVKQSLELAEDQVQCVISCSQELENAILPGRSQHPDLWDYADGVDTMDFLVKLK